MVEGVEFRRLDTLPLTGYYRTMQVINDFKTINPLVKIAAIIEFSKSVNKKRKNACWDWAGTTNAYGYGMFHYNNIAISAHRFAYLIKHGSIISGHHIHHMCENKLCVNVKHLKSVTPEEHKQIHTRINRAMSVKATTPWYRQKAERPKVNKTFSIYEEHSKVLDRNYQGQQSALVRLLMDRYFGGQLPDVAREFEMSRRK